MYRSAWHAGLKTTYYLRSLGASNIEKATVGVKKEMRGAVSEGSSGGQNSGDAGGSHSPLLTNAPFTPAAADVTQPPMAMGSASGLPTKKKEYTAEEKKACSIEAMRRGEECEA